MHTARTLPPLRENWVVDCHGPHFPHRDHGARTWMNTRVRVLSATDEDFDVVPTARGSAGR